MLSKPWRTSTSQPHIRAVSSKPRSREAAKALGSRSRMPVVGMAEYAIGSGDRETARAVFDAADQPGFHQSLLADRRASLGVEA